MITVVQWRAVIGSFNPTRKKTRSAQGIVISGRPIRTALRLILSLSLCIVLRGDVETNPGPEFNKRPLENTDNSPNDTTEPKRVDQRISPEVVSHGPNPPVEASLVSAANENHPLYTPGRPAVYLSLDSGVLTQKERPITRRCLTLDGVTDTTTADTGSTPYNNGKAETMATNRPTMTSSTAPTMTQEEEPVWAKKLIKRVETLEREIQTLKDSNSKLTNSKKNTQALENNIKRQDDEITHLRDQLLHNEARSMRSNLIFNNIPETNQNENPESVVRGFVEQKMGINTKEMEIERAHRLGKWRQGHNRPLVAKFLNFKDKEAIRQAAPRKLRNTKYGINEQYPKEISDRRKLLVPIMKEERKHQKRAKLVVDKLYTDDATYTVRGDQVHKEKKRVTRNFLNEQPRDRGGDQHHQQHQQHHQQQQQQQQQHQQQQHHQQQQRRGQHNNHDLHTNAHQMHQPTHGSRSAEQSDFPRSQDIRHSDLHTNAHPMHQSTYDSRSAEQWEDLGLRHSDLNSRNWPIVNGQFPHKYGSQNYHPDNQFANMNYNNNS